jgi:hypothetical protein
MGRNGKGKIQWHPAFYGAAELELRQNKDDLEFEREYNLSKEPLRTDLLIIKKRAAAEIKNEIGHIFKRFNIIEYKSPDDGISIDDYYKTIGYACLYKGLGGTVNTIPADELTITIVREAYPREMMKHLRHQGATIEEKYLGIYYVRGIASFDTQVVVTSKLEPGLHSSVRILSKNVKADDVKIFLKEAEKLEQPGDKKPIKADRQSLIIEYINNNGSVSNKEARELLLSGGTLREAQTAR